MEEDLVLQFITALSFSSSLLIMCILFMFFFLGVLGCSWVFLVVGGEEVESWWQKRCSVDGSGWMALLLL
jgi:hypothetical protein